jgi:hypothetical protein
MRSGTVRYVEHGFLVKQAGAVPATLTTFVLPDLPLEVVHFHHVIVEPDGAAATGHWVVEAHDPRLNEAICRGIRGAADAAGLTPVFSFILHDEMGLADVHTATGQSHGGAVSTAVAEVKRAGGWDDSEQFSISVDGVPFVVHLAWAAGRCRASVEEGAGQQ